MFCVLAMVVLVGWCSLLWWLFGFVDVDDLKIFGREMTLMFGAFEGVHINNYF